MRLFISQQWFTIDKVICFDGQNSTHIIILPDWTLKNGASPVFPSNLSQGPWNGGPNYLDVYKVHS